ncbi:MAG TPA: cobalamin biosynthesis protein [Methanomassiliicoccales archaeon]|nr:cobalamin biosynthesis protein [Methanomassiliicoccales archaeon]
MFELVPYALLTIIIALLIDRFIGEPPNSLHPVVWMGKVISFFDERIARGHPRRERLFGALMALAVILMFSIAVLLLMALVRDSLGLLVWAVVGGILLKTMFAMSAMGKHTEPVRQALLAGDLELGRQKAAMMVSRDVSQLDKEHVISCAAESAAENTVDSIFSPLFYFGLLGLPAAVAYRVSNTLDAMVGYLDDKHRYVGWFSAKLDDGTNFVMARAAVPFILLALFILGKDWNAGWKASKKFHDQTLSPNKGWHMSAFAGGLGIRFEKIGWYVMGDGPLPSDPEVLRDTIKVMTMASYLFLLTVVIPLYLLVGAEVQVFVEDILLGLIGV